MQLPSKERTSVPFLFSAQINNFEKLSKTIIVVIKFTLNTFEKDLLQKFESSNGKASACLNVQIIHND